MHFPITLKNEDLEDINQRLPWFAGTSLPDGRLLGKIDARPGKRSALQDIPDKRITRLDDVIGLSGKRVLEVGCFEGIHSIGLCGYGANVMAVDLRPINVIKTAVRLACYGYSAQTFVLDVEEPSVDLPDFDLVFHCGVLYHLEDPIAHLARLLPKARAIYLDTHVARDTQEDSVLEAGGKTYVGHQHHEGGWSDPFSGRGAGAFWLKQADLIGFLQEHGFSTDLWSEREERNGLRIGVLGTRI